jgi:hypothetical protein
MDFVALAYHYFTIIFMHDFIPVAGGGFSEDSPWLELAYRIAGL